MIVNKYSRYTFGFAEINYFCHYYRFNTFNPCLLKTKTMGDEAKNSSTATEEAPQYNQDELIMAQQRQIEKEISETIPLVGNFENILTLEREYSNDAIYKEKIRNLSQKYGNIRRTRPDGNCFFRAFSFAYIERLLNNREEFDAFFKRAEKSKDVLVELGFQQFTVEDFYDTYMDVLRRVGEIENQDEAKAELLNLFNDQGYSDYMVVYLRLLTSGQLQKEKDFYSCFIEGHRSVEDFCHQEVEPMYKESDHIHIIAACAALETGVRVVYMDRGIGKAVTEHDLPEGCVPFVHLLYRPGHYDILYPV